MTEKEKMLAGELYNHRDPELVALHRRAQILYERLNATPVTQPEKRKQIISELFGSAGKNCLPLPDSTFSAINPAMFTGSLADEKGGA